MPDKLLIWLWRHWKPLAIWSTWLTLVLGVGLLLGSSLNEGHDPSWFLPGTTSHGHYQIEKNCRACHSPFQGVSQDACNKCHAAELAKANDTHPLKKFRDPRNTHLLEKIDAMKCVTCHGEHRPDQTLPLGVTQPADFCGHCHGDVGKDRPSHKNLAFDGCRTCHNYHDNRALYEDFLGKHLDEPETWEPAKAVLPNRNILVFYREKAEHPTAPLSPTQQNGPTDTDAAPVGEWEHSSHAQAGVNCRDCHTRPDNPAWINKPDHSYCETCHQDEVKGFLGGHHGMKLAQGMAAMNTLDARLAMREPAQTMTCNTCHAAHRFTTDAIAEGVENCLKCHADPHSLAYKSSRHYRILIETQKDGALNKSVSCAACHLPREAVRQKGKERIKVQHNQNDNLRPNQKMLRDVCMRCHGLGFSLDALADKELIKRNFNERPKIHLPSLEMTEQRIRNKSEQRQLQQQ